MNNTTAITIESSQAVDKTTRGSSADSSHASQLDQCSSLAQSALQKLVAMQANLPLPGSGSTLARWHALSDVAAQDLCLVKLFEGHTDALAILHELNFTYPENSAFSPAGAVPRTWGVWAAEPPDARVRVDMTERLGVSLTGRKSWCSGAAQLSHALVTAWQADGASPQLVAVALDQPGVRITNEGWCAVGMAASNSVDVIFDGAVGYAVGQPGAYLTRPGFWHGGAGIAACWYGGAQALASYLRLSLKTHPGQLSSQAYRLAALGRCDVALQQTAAMLRELATWIDANPKLDARVQVLRVRLSAEGAAKRVLDEVGTALGAGPYCRDARFARLAADLPVFIRQSGADRDLQSLGENAVAATHDLWALTAPIP